MTRRQKIFLWILFAIHVFFIYSCIDGYYDAIIKGCVDWGPSNHCPWGSEAMGIVWENPYSYVYFVSRNFIESLSVVIFAIIAFVFYAIKIVYLPMYFLLVFVLKEKYNTQKTIKIFFGISIFFLALVLLFQIPKFFSSEIVITSDSVVKNQMIFVLHNPIEYLRIMLSTIKENRDFFVSSTVGVFGLVDTYLYSAIVYPYIFFLFMVGFFEISIQNVSINWIQRLAVFVSVLAGIFGTFLAMYIFWTSKMEGSGVGAESITGVQGRYFIPFLPIVFLCFANKYVPKVSVVSRLAWKIVDNSVLVSIMILVVSEAMILLRFWI